MKILMVCLGNICRSPLAEALLRQKTLDAGLDVDIDSAGFESCNVGDAPDYRTQQNALRNGLDVSYLRARLFRTDDFDHFDKIYIMDHNNKQMISRFARNSDDMRKVDYIMNAVFPGKDYCVADPYYSGERSFQQVFEQLDEACEAICNKLINNEKL